LLEPLKDDKFREQYEDSPLRPGLPEAVQLMYRADVLNHQGEVLIE
jgi:hypothetical protein